MVDHNNKLLLNSVNFNEVSTQLNFVKAKTNTQTYVLAIYDLVRST